MGTVVGMSLSTRAWVADGDEWGSGGGLELRGSTLCPAMMIVVVVNTPSSGESRVEVW